MASKNKETQSKRKREQDKKQKAKDKAARRQAKKPDGTIVEDSDKKDTDPDESNVRTVKGMKVIVRNR